MSYNDRRNLLEDESNDSVEDDLERLNAMYGEGEDEETESEESERNRERQRFVSSRDSDYSDDEEDAYSYNSADLDAYYCQDGYKNKQRGSGCSFTIIGPALIALCILFTGIYFWYTEQLDGAIVFNSQSIEAQGIGNMTLAGTNGDGMLSSDEFTDGAPGSESNGGGESPITSPTVVDGDGSLSSPTSPSDSDIDGDGGESSSDVDDSGTNDNNSNAGPTGSSPTPSPVETGNNPTRAPVSGNDWYEIYSFPITDSESSYSVSLSASGDKAALMTSDGIYIVKEKSPGGEDWILDGRIEIKTIEDATQTDWSTIVNRQDTKAANIQLSSDGSQLLFDVAYSDRGVLCLLETTTASNNNNNNGANETSTTWVSKGTHRGYEKIPGGSRFGTSTGYATQKKNRVSVGGYAGTSVRIYDNQNDNNWEKVGNNIIPEQPSSTSIFANIFAGTAAATEEEENTFFGASVAMSADGNSVVVSDPKYGCENEGRVQVFQLNENRWVQKGNSIDGKPDRKIIGVVTISDSGETIGIGLPQEGENNVGQVRILKYDGSMWKSVSKVLEGGQRKDNFGQIVTLSGNGKYIGVIAPGTGNICVYEDTGGEIWELYGECLVYVNDSSSSSNNIVGYSISLSKNGQRMAITSPEKTSVKIYAFNRA